MHPQQTILLYGVSKKELRSPNGDELVLDDWGLCSGVVQLEKESALPAPPLRLKRMSAPSIDRKTINLNMRNSICSMGRRLRCYI